MRKTSATLALALALASALPVPAYPLDWIRRESGRDWTLACSEESVRVNRVCTVQADVRLPEWAQASCSFSVFVLPRRSFLRLKCDRDLDGLGITVESGSNVLVASTPESAKVVDVGDPRLVDEVITALKLERRPVSLDIRPLDAEPLQSVLDTKDFDKMYGQALVVSDQIL